MSQLKSIPGHPSVSAVICCYNHAEFVVASLESVRSQTVLPTELIITDDASTDRSVELITNWANEYWPSAHLIFNATNRGLPGTLNRAVPRLTGDFVVLMSADDLMRSDRIQRQLSAFNDAAPSVGMAYSDMVEMDEHGVPTGQRWFDPDRMGPCPGSGDLFGAMIGRASMAAPTVMVRRELLQSVGPYDESLVAEDYDMFLRLSREAEWTYVDEPLVDYRVLSSSLSRSEEFSRRQRAGRIHLLRKHTGLSPATDRIIADRTAQMAKSLYLEGRPSSLTAADIRFALGIRPKTHDALFLAISRCRVPGTIAARAIRLAARLRSLRKGPRAATTQRDREA